MKLIRDDFEVEWYMGTMECPECHVPFMMWQDPSFCPCCGGEFDKENKVKKTECCICGEEFESEGSAYCSFSCLEEAVKRGPRK